jgi:ATP-binding cassette, subfamily B, bacterial
MREITKTLRAKLQKVLLFLPALRLVWQSSPGWTIARVALLITQGILPLLSIYLTKLIVDSVTTGLTAPDKIAAFYQVLTVLILAGIVTVINGLCTSLSEFVNTAHSMRVNNYMQGIIHTKSVEADLEYYENAQYFDALQRAQQEAPYRPPQILNRLAQVGQNGISLVAMVGLLLSLHWGIIGVLMIAALPAVWVRVKQSQIMYDWQRQRTSMERQSQYLGFMLTGEHFAKEIRLFGLGSFFSEWYQRIREQIYQERLDISKRKALANFIAQAFAGVLIFAIYSFIIFQTIQGTLRLGDLVLYYQALQRGQLNINGLLTGLSGLYEDNLFLTNLYEFLDLKPNIVDPVHPKPFPETIKTGIIFHQVSFQYANSTRQALHNISLTLEPGKTIALVGENGCGKTTLIKLLCRLYDPTSGSITIDGMDIRNFEIADLRQQVSVIFQDYAKYHFTAFENIWLGNIEVPRGDEKIRAAALRSGADQVIQELPQGYETILGKLFDQGEELSIGQWQKIALARAFLRSSQLIILDEPTSAMDPKAEYEVFKQFRALIKDQAAILITHRLSTVKMADCIYVMDQGSIVERGTHQELIEQRGTYAHLFETQAQNYR